MSGEREREIYLYMSTRIHTPIEAIQILRNTYGGGGNFKRYMALKGVGILNSNMFSLKRVMP